MSGFKYQFADVLTYPEHPGFTEKGGASEAVADRLASTLKRNQTEVLHAFHRAGKPMTADELAEFAGKTIVSIRPRVSELRRVGLIVSTGERRASSFGQPSTVWKLRPTPAEPAPIAIPRHESAPTIEGPTPEWHWIGRAFSVTREQYDHWFFSFTNIRDLSAALQAIDNLFAEHRAGEAIDLLHVSQLLASANSTTTGGAANAG